MYIILRLSICHSVPFHEKMCRVLLSCYAVMNDVVNFNYPENNVKGQKLDAHERSV